MTEINLNCGLLVGLKLLNRFENSKKKIHISNWVWTFWLTSYRNFYEVFRTTMVIKAFKYLSDIPTKLFVFSDDMDGLRKVPQNIPNQNLIKENLDKPLSSIPDPLENLRVFLTIIIICLLNF